MNPKLILGLALVLSGGLFGCSTANAPVKKRIVGSWTNTVVRLVVPGSASAKSQTEKVTAKRADYEIVNKPNKGVYVDEVEVLAIHDPFTRKNYILPECDFYLSGSKGITGYRAVPFDLVWNSSYLELSDTTGNLDAVIDKFEAQVDGRMLNAEYMKVGMANRISLSEATSEKFWGHYGSVPEVEAIVVTNGIMQLDLAGADKFKATVWIDLKKKKAIRTIENGVEMNIHSGLPWAVSRSGVPMTNKPTILNQPTDLPANAPGIDPRTGLPLPPDNK